MNNPVAFFATVGILLACSLTFICFYLWRVSRNRSLHVQQRQSRFTLFVFMISLVDYFILAILLRYPWEPSICVMGLFGFVGLTPLIGRAESRQGKITMDERDQKIGMTATAAGFATFWGGLCLAWTIWFGILGPNGTVTIGIGDLGLVLPAGMVVILSVRALVTLFLYWRDAHAETK